MKIIKRLIWLVLIVVLGLIVYRVVFDVEKYNVLVNQEFTLKLYDYAKLDDTTIKLIKIKDERCKEENCDREGQMEYKLLVMNDMRFNIVTLKTLEEPDKKIEKTDYTIHWLEDKSDSATFKITEKVRKEEK